MGFAGFLFITWRIFEIVTLIPAMGMLAWFVHQYVSQGVLTPDFIVVLFVVSTLAVAWTIATLVLYASARHSAMFVAVVDILFVGAFIAGVYLLRGIANADCTHWNSGSVYVSVGGLSYQHQGDGQGWGFSINKSCAMLKASFAFGIMNCILFFITSILALMVHHHHRSERTTVVREKHYSRHGHRRSSGGGSPRRSHHSQRGSYY